MDVRQMTKYRSIRISEETYIELTKVLGELMAKDPNIKTYDKAIRKLIETYKASSLKD